MAGTSKKKPKKVSKKQAPRSTKTAAKGQVKLQQPQARSGGRLRLTAEGARIVKSAIDALDPNHDFVNLDVEKKTVSYSESFVLHEALSVFEGEEEIVRAYIVTWLCTLGGYLPSNIELEKRYSIGRPKEGAELDILVKYPTGETYALIEVKAPDEFDFDQDKYIEGQLFNIAPHEPGCKVLSHATISIANGAVRIDAVTIDYTTHNDFSRWKQSRAAANEIPANYGEPVHVHIERGSEKDLKMNLSADYFRTLRKRLHDILWKGSTPDNIIYSYVVKLFLTKIYDEKNTPVGGRYHFQIYYTGSQRESTDTTVARITARYQEAYKRYLSADGTEPEPFNTREFSKEQVAFVVQLMQEVSLTSPNSSSADVLGSFFEGITRDGFKQSKGLFFTHLNIVWFILDVLQIQELAAAKIQSGLDYRARLPYVIDPSCGSGTFLLAAMHAITQFIADNRESLSQVEDVADFIRAQFPAGQENLWAKDFLYGIDQSDLLSMASKVNMVLRRDGNTHVFHGDGLAPLSRFNDQFLRGTAHEDPSCYSKYVAKSFDVVISNPPFSITLDPDTVNQLENTFELAKERNSENLFLERWYQLLKPRGRLGVVLPESFFSTKENLNARLFLFAHFNLKAVVALPRHAFEPWTPTRTSLLFAQKKTVEEERAWKDSCVAIESRLKEAKGRCKKLVRQLVAGINIARECGTQEWRNSVQGQLKSVLPDSAPPNFAPGLSVLATLNGLLEEISGAPETVKDKEIREARKSVGSAQKLISGAIEALNALSAVASDLEYQSPMPSASDELDSLEAFAQNLDTFASDIDVRLRGFAKAAKEHDQSFYVLGVDNIGYKRTKRTEYEQHNDLFEAYQTVEEGKKERILNLNHFPGRWQIQHVTGDSAAVMLRKAGLWA